MTSLISRPSSTGPALAEHLTARLETALSQHLERAQQWYPHEYVPWGQAQDFADQPFEET